MQGFSFSSRHLKIFIYVCWVVHFFCLSSYFSLFMVTVTVSLARVSPWVPPESVQGQCKVSSPPIFSSLSQSIFFFYLQGSLMETGWPSAPIASDRAHHFKSSLMEMTFSGRYTICVQLYRLNKEKIKSGPCPYPPATFERCTWGSLTAAKHSSVWGKLVLLFRAAFECLCAELSDWGATLFQPPYSSACQAQTWWE